MKISTTDKAVQRAQRLSPAVSGVYTVLGWVENMGESGALLRGYNGILMMQTARDLLMLDQAEAYARLVQSQRSKGAAKTISEQDRKKAFEKFEELLKARGKAEASKK